MDPTNQRALVRMRSTNFVIGPHMGDVIRDRRKPRKAIYWQCMRAYILLQWLALETRQVLQGVNTFHSLAGC